MPFESLELAGAEEGVDLDGVQDLKRAGTDRLMKRGLKLHVEGAKLEREMEGE
jgi:hypothetical protein